jgi:hypothetical protein
MKKRTIVVGVAAAVAIGTPTVGYAATHSATTRPAVTVRTLSSAQAYAAAAKTGVTIRPNSCGEKWATSDGYGGWYLAWVACGTFPIAPQWFNGIGDRFANVTENECGHPSYVGQALVWHIPVGRLPFEATNYSGVVICLG